LAAFNQYPLEGWDARNSASINNATFFAIVVGTGVMPAASSITYQSISCQDGNSPTIPAPKTFAQNLQDCQQYFWRTFPYGVEIGAQRGFAGAISIMLQSVYSNSGTTLFAFGNSAFISFPVQMEINPLLTFYNPVNNNNQWHVPETPASFPALDLGAPVATSSLSVNGFGVNCVITPASVNAAYYNNSAYVHATADARLGR
jgi:hypothetical protein